LTGCQVISVHQRSSAFISVHQRSSAFISVHQRSSAFISVHQRSSAFIGGGVNIGVNHEWGNRGLGLHQQVWLP
jgi:hypothetical protein